MSDTSVGQRAGGSWRGALGAALRAAALAAFALVLWSSASGVHAQDDFELEDTPQRDPRAREKLVRTPSRFELGSYWTSENSYKFGDFTGLEAKRPYLLADFSLRSQALHEEGATRYWNIEGQNLGLDSRRLSAQFGDQGRFALGLWFDQTPKRLSDTSASPFRGKGSTRLVLPAGWVAGGDTSTMTTLAPSASPFRIDFERQQAGARFSFALPGDWQMVGRYARETKQGERMKGLVIGNTGGNPRAALLPEPIDYTTHRGELGFEWATELGQARVGYQISSFLNTDSALRWQNPFAQIAGWQAGAVGFANGGTGTKALAPDNLFHQATLDAGYALAPSLRVTLNSAFGRMTQEERFLPYSGNSALTVTTPMPRRDLHGEIRTSLVKLGFTAQPLGRLQLRGGYRYDERDNQTPSATYIYIGGDSQNQPALNSDKARINHPYSFRTNEFSLGASYPLLRSATLALDYERERIDRDHQEADWTREDQFRLSLRTRPSRWLSTAFDVGYGDRDASRYRGAEPFLTSHSPEHIATLAAGTAFENHPLMRRPYLADRERLDWGVRSAITPIDGISLALHVRQTADDYNESTVGLTDGKVFSYGADLSWSMGEASSAHLFYSAERFDTQQIGWSFRSGGNKLPDVADPRRRWASQNLDRVDTFGFGMTRALAGGRTRLGLDYVFSRSRNMLEMGLGTALRPALVPPGTTRPFPDAVTRLHGLNLYVERELRPGMRLRLSYLLERFDSSDWALDGIEPTSINRVISDGEDSVDYRAHLAGLSIVYEFH